MEIYMFFNLKLENRWYGVMQCQSHLSSGKEVGRWTRNDKAVLKARRKKQC